MSDKIKSFGTPALLKMRDSVRLNPNDEAASAGFTLDEIDDELIRRQPHIQPRPKGTGLQLAVEEWPPGWDGGPPGYAGPGSSRYVPPGAVAAQSHAPSRFAYRNASGTWTRDVGRGESMWDACGEKPTVAPSLGEICTAMLVGPRRGLESAAASIRTSEDSAGGVLISTATSREFIDKARAAMVMNRAGCRFLPFPEGASEFKIGRVATDPLSYWRREGAAITAGCPTFEGLTMTPHTLGCLVPVSVEWLEDVTGGPELIEQVIVRSMAVELDKVVLRGTGGAEPTGIRYTDSVNSTASVGNWSWNILCDGLKTCWDDNMDVPPSAIIWSPATANEACQKVDGDGAWALPPFVLRDVQQLVTTSIPDTLGAGTETEIYLGDFSQCLVVTKTNFKVEVLPSGTGTDASGVNYNATTELYRWIRCYGRFDCHVTKPGFLWYGSGVTNP